MCMWPCTKLKKKTWSVTSPEGTQKAVTKSSALPPVSALLSSNMVRRKLTQTTAGASPPSWVRQKLTPASAKAPPPRPSRAPLPPSPRKMTNHVAGAARANEEERERAKGQAFSTEEDDTLRKARWQPGWTWKGITSQLPGRSERATRDRWRLLQQQDAQVGEEGSAPLGSVPPGRIFWSAQEDATIRKARAEPGWSWKGITSQLPGRSKKAAQERWRLLRQQDAQVGEEGSAPGECPPGTSDLECPGGRYHLQGACRARMDMDGDCVAAPRPIRRSGIESMETTPAGTIASDCWRGRAGN